MVIEIIAARILAPHIGVSLYTWTSIIGVILAGIALGNYIGGKISDRYPSPLILASMFYIGAFLTVAIIPTTNIVTSRGFFDNLPTILDFTLKTSLIFFLPAIVLSMVSPMVIKLTLANLERTGGIVGTIYACSTLGAIVGTFGTGFYFILWFGTNMIIWLIAAVLIIAGIMTLFLWRTSTKGRFSLKNLITWITTIVIVLVFCFFFNFWCTVQQFYPKEIYHKESNYHTIRVVPGRGDLQHLKILYLDKMVHGFISPNEPTTLTYYYIRVFADITKYTHSHNDNLRILHLGGGGYTFPRYLDAVYPGSINEVVEIDPFVTKAAYGVMGLPPDTDIKTFNQDARFFLIQQETEAKYNIVIGDVFNDHSVPYHLTTKEFNDLVKASMEDDGIYLVNIVDNYSHGRFMASFIHTLRQTFNNVYLFTMTENPEELAINTFVIAATDRHFDLNAYQNYINNEGNTYLGITYDASMLDKYLAQRNPVLITDDYAPTDILIAPLFHGMYAGE